RPDGPRPEGLWPDGALHGMKRWNIVISARPYFAQDDRVNTQSRRQESPMTDQPFHIVFALFPGLTQLDFTGPHQILSRLPGAKVTVASAGGGEIVGEGLCFAGLARLGDIERCDLICVPGGVSVGDAIADEIFMRELKRLAAGARYVTSVCT